jgi:hypothetical protein
MKKLITVKPSLKNLLLGAGLAGVAIALGACGGGYVDGGGGGVAVIDTDYYGPGFGGRVGYGHPDYHADSHVAGPPRQAWHGSAPHGASGGHSAPSGGGGDRDRK